MSKIPFDALINMYQFGGTYPKVNFEYSLGAVDRQKIEQILQKLQFEAGIINTTVPLWTRPISEQKYWMDKIGKYDEWKYYADQLNQKLIKDTTIPLDSAEINYMTDDEYMEYMNSISPYSPPEPEPEVIDIPEVEYSLVMDPNTLFTGTQPLQTIMETYLNEWVYFPADFPNTRGLYMTFYAGKSFYIPNQYAIVGWATDLLWKSDLYRWRYLCISWTGVNIPSGPTMLTFPSLALYPALCFVAYADERASWLPEFKRPLYPNEVPESMPYIRDDVDYMNFFNFVKYLEDNGHIPKPKYYSVVH